ncbi:MAG: hypothetical protein AB8B56_18555 [Crocinitomicaceae bacterium]
MCKKTILSICLLSFTFFSTAQDKTDRKGEPTEELQNVISAKQLALYGYSNNDPICVLTAAKMLIANPATTLAPEKTESGTEDTAPEKENNIELNLDVVQLIGDARKMANGNEVTMALANEIESTIPPSTKGAVGGARIVEERVNSNDYDIYYIRFYGNELAEVAISGDGDTDLDLYIYDESGNLIDSDSDYTDECYVSWRPKWTGSFKIKVVNRGSVYNNYVLGTN